MTGLLVSVTSAAEAIIARDNGADLIDVKDPAQGSLGAQPPAVWREVIAAVGGQVPVSAALGELYDGQALKLASQTAGLAFAKVGLAKLGIANRSSGAEAQTIWQHRWQQWRALLPVTVQPVLVLYADGKGCDAPSAAELLEFAAEQRALPAANRVAGVLIDTYQKAGGRLLDHCRSSQLQELCRTIRAIDCRLVLAGSLQLCDLPEILPLAPDYIAVRGAVCSGSRNGPVSGALVREWSRAIGERRGVSPTCLP